MLKCVPIGLTVADAVIYGNRFGDESTMKAQRSQFAKDELYCTMVFYFALCQL